MLFVQFDARCAIENAATSNTKTQSFALEIFATSHSCYTHFVFNGGLLVLVQMHFDQLSTIQLHADTFADNFSWEHKIVEDGIVHSGQGTATWTLLLVGVWATALRLGKDLAFGAEHDVTAREFLLQLANQTRLDLLESLLLGNWNVNDDCLKEKLLSERRLEASRAHLLVAELHFSGTSDV